MSGEKCISWTKTIDFELIKEIKMRTGTTVNDVLLTCLAGSLRRYLRSEGMDNPTDVQIIVTVNTRSPNILSRDNIPLENHSSGSLYNLPVGVADPLKRLLETKRRMDNFKSSSDWRVFGFIHSQIVGRLPDFIGRFVAFAFSPHCSLILSNVPGPLTPFQIGGKEVMTAIAWPPLIGDTGMSIAMFSYAGTLRMSVLSDKAVLANPGKLTEKFIEEFDEMYEYVKNGPTLIAVDSTACKKYF
ncbi:hypothetical protein OS493_038839 [Desmophyllum pertusum]|uniref:O-acyltransferase WSD1 C-terminal domain-containing protein n=1 Tax=Desmophyllum pertusum TaxID=174260 RepID=A0A9X0CCG7_9CNID|nr:hypothetical protein OS493_038839 [Desmophyllum pertusum]